MLINKNTSRSLLALLLGAFLITSIGCEDEIDIELQTGEKQLVVDAWLNDLNQDQIITLTYSQALGETTVPETIDDASIVLIEGDVLYPVEFIGQGQYKIMNDNFVNLGSTYTLDIKLANGNTYASTTQVYPSPVIDSIVPEFREDEVFGPDGYYAQFYARDLPGFGNTYWIKAFKNDNFLNDPFEINLAYDAAFDAGGMVDNFVFITPIRELINPVPSEEDTENEVAPYALGDKIRVEIHSISNEAFEFMEVARDQLQNGSNGIFASPITNTVGNVTSNDTDEIVLGVFNIAQVTSMEVEVK